MLLGRLCLALLFLQSGIDKLFNYDKTLKLMAVKGMPFTEWLLPPAIVILVAGGLMLLAGWKARWAALALILFMIPATLYFHAFWTYPEAQYVNQLHHFFKNVAIIGALFLVLGAGTGALSLEREQA
jgi:putative oxidoreductase